MPAPVAHAPWFSMIIVWAATPELGQLVVDHAGTPVILHAGPDDIHAAVKGASLLIIAADNVGDEPARKLIDACRAARPGLPILAVARFDLGLSRGLAHVEVDGVVWIREASDYLAEAIHEATTSPARQQLANLIRHWEEANPVLRNALYEATRAVVPPRSVQALAREHGVSPIGSSGDGERSCRRRFGSRISSCLYARFASRKHAGTA